MLWLVRLFFGVAREVFFFDVVWYGLVGCGLWTVDYGSELCCRGREWVVTEGYECREE